MPKESIETWTEKREQIDEIVPLINETLPMSSLARENDFPTESEGEIAKENASANVTAEVSTGSSDNHTVNKDPDQRTQILEVSHSQTSQATSLPVVIPSEKKVWI